MTATERSDPALRQLHRRLQAFVRRRVSDPNVAEDLAQEIMLRLHAAGDRLRDEGRVEAYAYRIARNVIIDHWRAADDHLSLDGSGAGRDSSTSTSPGDATATDDELRAVLGQWLGSRIDQLPPRDRELVRRVELDGESQREVAEALGLPYSTMKSRVQRARTRLHADLIACCRVELDARGRVTDFEPRQGQGACGCGPTQRDPDR